MKVGVDADNVPESIDGTYISQFRSPKAEIGDCSMCRLIWVRSVGVLGEAEGGACTMVTGQWRGA